jgi:hypothetical protein
LFSSYFPNVEDIKLIIATGIVEVYFTGKIEDSQAVELLNKSNDAGIQIKMHQFEK